MWTSGHTDVARLAVTAALVGALRVGRDPIVVIVALRSRLRNLFSPLVSFQLERLDQVITPLGSGLGHAERPVGQHDTTGRLPGRSACPRALGRELHLTSFVHTQTRALPSDPLREPIDLPPGE
jgi:hypothetical protein